MKRYLLFIYDSPLSYYAMKQLQKLLSQLEKNDVVLINCKQQSDDFIIYNAMFYKNEIILFTTAETSDTIQEIIFYLFKNYKYGQMIELAKSSDVVSMICKQVDYVIVIETHKYSHQLAFLDHLINLVPVFVLVHSADSKCANNLLIKAGATMIENIQDIY